VADKERVITPDHDANQGDAGEGRQFAVELLDVTGFDFESAAWTRS